MKSRRFNIADLEPWIDERFDRAAGPGGQNVNKLNTRVTLLFAFEICDVLSPVDRERIHRRLARRLAADGRLRIVSQETRSQDANRTAARQRLLELLEQALYVAPLRKATRPSFGSKARRLKAKRQRAEIKQIRQGRRGTQSD